MSVSQRILTSDPSASVTGHGAVMIAWFCFIGVTGSIFVSAVGYCIYCHWRNERMRQLAEENLDEDVRNGELDAELSRIEANIKIFTEIERRIKMDCLRKRMRKQKMTVSAEDVRSKRIISSTSCRQEYDLSDGCNVCMEAFAEGDTVYHSCIKSTPDCLHLFHQHCILNWLAQKQTCPCCVRMFVEDDSLDENSTPRSSLSSEDFHRSMNL